VCVYLCANNASFQRVYIIYVYTYIYAHKNTHTRIIYKRKRDRARERVMVTRTRESVYNVYNMCIYTYIYIYICACEALREREDCTSKLKFALFSRGSAIVPACRCYLTPGRRRRRRPPPPPLPPPPVRKTLRLAASGLHYSYKSFLVNIFLCSATAAALPTFHFCLLLPPRLRGRSLPHTATRVSSRLVSSRTPPLHSNRALLQTSHKLSIDPDHRHTYPPASSLRFLSLPSPPLPPPPTSFHMYI